MQTRTSRKFIVFFFKVVALVTEGIVRIIDDSFARQALKIRACSAMLTTQFCWQVPVEVIGEAFIDPFIRHRDHQK